MRNPAVYCVIAAACMLLNSCTEERTVSRTSSSFTGMSPVPTRTSEPKTAPHNSSGGGDFFGEVGDGISTLFEEKGDKNDGGWQIITPLGQKIKLSKNYSGQTLFRTREGPAYRLTFKDGALVMIEPEEKPGINQLKPGTLGAPGSPGATPSPTNPRAPGAPVKTPAPAEAPDEGEVPRPVAPSTPNTND